MKYKIALTPLVFLVIVTAACKKKNEDPVPPPAPADVYVAGYSYDAQAVPTILTGTYWKNRTASVIAGTRQIKSIIVSGADTYLLSDSGYFKNKVYTALSDIAYTYSFFVSGKDVYVAGMLDNPAIAGGYWKNGVLTALPRTDITTGITPVFLTSIFISGNDFYACGNIFFSGRDTAVYWKNNKMYYIPDGKVAGPIVVSGSDIYILGTAKSLMSSKSTGDAYWKNGVLHGLGDNTVTTTMKVHGSDVYITGLVPTATTTQAVYWKNGVQNILPGAAAATDIAFSGTDIYVAGFAAGNLAVWWKNGKADTLGHGAAISIAVHN